MTNPNQPPQLREWYAAYRQRFLASVDQLANQLPQRTQRFPAPVHWFVSRQPKLTLILLAVVTALLVIWMGGRFLSGVFSGLLLLAIFAIYIGSWAWLLKLRMEQGIKVGKAIVFSAIAFFIGGFIPFLPHIILLLVENGDSVRRGTKLVRDVDLQRILIKRQSEMPASVARYPLLDIAGIELPTYLENLGFFFVGSPGSGKTQAIKRLLAILKQRPDFRVMVLDRNGELLETFYQEGFDLLFNPRDTRSLTWNHVSEGMEPETIAAALVPDDPKDRFFSEAAKSLLADLYERCRSNAEVWEVISTFSMKDLQDFLTGGVSARYFGGENTGASVLSTLVNEMRFYRKLFDDEGFSFSKWGRSDDPRWVFCSIFEDDAELFKSLYSMAFELMLKGLLSHPDPEARQMKTAIVIDELGALNQLRSLSRLLAEARKFGGTAILGTQTEAQIDRNYGELDRRTILQGTATKLILNCRDGQTAEMMANLIGKQERIDTTYGRSSQGLRTSYSQNEQIRETHAVMPSQLQALPQLEGYLTISDGTPPAQVKLVAQSYPKQAVRFIPCTIPNYSPTLPPATGEGGNNGGKGKTQQFNRFEQRGR